MPEGRLEAELVALTPAVERGELAAMGRYLAALAALHQITIEVRTTMPAGCSAFAEPAARRVVIPPCEDAVAFAIGLHEIGHCLAEPCRGGDHRPDPTVREWSHCVRCEVLAWHHAMRLAPFSRAMFARLRQSLAWYRERTPAPASAIRELDTLRGRVTFETGRLARLRRVDRFERQARVLREIRDAEDRASRDRMRRLFPQYARTI